MSTFDAYLMVDWSANSTPKRGEDSIWYCLLKREYGALREVEVKNPATRYEAVGQIEGLLKYLASANVRTLVGFDFPYGYPAGFAAKLGLHRNKPWRAIWTELTKRIQDQPDNTNNRFEVAGSLNYMVSGSPFPFWGCPSEFVSSCLSSGKYREQRVGDLSEWRITERRGSRRPQPVWKLFYTGSVGSQALLGIPCLARIRDGKLSSVSRVWPFETGLRAPQPDAMLGPLILHAEIFPSLLEVERSESEIKDKTQVCQLAEYFAQADQQGSLSAMFEPEGLSPSEQELVSNEEGWILGVK